MGRWLAANWWKLALGYVGVGVVGIVGITVADKNLKVKDLINPASFPYSAPVIFGWPYYLPQAIANRLTAS